MKSISRLALAVLGLLAPASAGADELDSNLPIFVIHTEAAINAADKVRGTMKVVDNGEGQRNHSTDTTANYNGYVGIKWRGNSSLSFDQKKYTLETQDAEGNDLKTSLLGMPEESDWVLLAPYNDISLVRDVFAFSLWNEMGHWGPRTRMCEVIVNDEYMGVYIFCEKIKRDKNRVDIAKLKTDDTADRPLTGGYIVRVDAFDEEDATFTSQVKGLQTGMWGGAQQGGTVTWTVYYPKKADLQPEQKSYIEQFVAQMEQSFQAANFADPDEGYARWIDVPSFVDYFIHTELSLNADGFKRSSYFFKDKDKKDGTLSKMEAGPVWDFNLAYGNCNFCNANNPEAWVYEGCNTNPTPVFWKKLTSDPRFMSAVRERYAQLRQTLLSKERIDQFFDDYAALLSEAKDRHYAKYSNLLSSGGSQQGGGWPWGWPWGGGTVNPVAQFAAYTVASYEEEIQTVKKWFARRLAFLDRSWGYDATASIEAPEGYFSVKASISGSGQLTIESDRPLLGIEVFSLGGNRLASLRPSAGSLRQRFLLPPRCTSSPMPLIVACHAADGSYITYKIRMTAR